jgi:hypothetical protein
MDISNRTAMNIRKKSLFRRIVNRVLAFLAKSLPGSESLRPFLHRLRGVRITGHVFIGDEVYLENEFPEAVEIHDCAQIGVRCIIMAHTMGLGKVIIGKDAFIGANCVVAASPGKTLSIGEGAVLVASSVVLTSVPAHMLFGGERARPLARLSSPLNHLKPGCSYDQFVAGMRPFKDAAATHPCVSETSSLVPAVPRT